MFEPEMRMKVSSLEAGHWNQVRQIYLDGIASGQATFETAAPSWKEWDSNHLRVGRILAVSEISGEILGWAALSRVSTRAVYEGVAEVSVYVATGARGKGVGKTLLDALVHKADENGLWTLQASVFPENLASVALHKSCGFREVGLRERIACLKGAWRDTLLLERRSRLVGI